MATLVAVYGTLKENESNYFVHLAPRKPIKSGFFSIPYTMYSNGFYPMLIPSSLQKIYLEIYSVDNEKLKILDDLEIPYNYHRRTIQIEEDEIELYVYNEPSNPPEFQLVSNGNFIAKGDINKMKLN